MAQAEIKSLIEHGSQSVIVILFLCNHVVFLEINISPLYVKIR